MVPRHPPHPWLGIKNCHEAKTNRKTTLWVCVFYVCLPPIPFPDVSQSSLRGKQIQKKWFVKLFVVNVRPPASSHPQRQSKFPSGGKNIGKTLFQLVFFTFFRKNENDTKMITSCSIRRVGRR